MYTVVLIVHIMISLFLIAVVLLQGGRGGMGEALGGPAAQSLFGGGANIVMSRITAVCAGLFVVTCLSLAALSTARGRSVIDRLPSKPTTTTLPLPEGETAPAPSHSPAAPTGTSPNVPQPTAAPQPMTPGAATLTAPAPSPTQGVQPIAPPAAAAGPTSDSSHSP